MLDDDSSTLKFVLLGEGGTGKTQIARRFCTLPFINAHQHTTGLDLYHKKLTLDGASTWVELWDVSGESLSSRFAPNIVADADAIFLVYDVTHFGSFQSMDEWLRLVYRVFGTVELPVRNAKDARLPYMACIANKMDLAHIRTVKQDKHEHFMKLNCLPSFALSAKVGELAPTLLNWVAAQLGGGESGVSNADYNTILDNASSWGKIADLDVMSIVSGEDQQPEGKRCGVQ